jgi:hypothetical protein
MRRILASLALLGFLVPLASATHDTGCVPTSVDPATYRVVAEPVSGRTFYDLEEDVAPNPNIPGGGVLWASGTWVYEEANGLDGLQRGDVGVLGPCLDPFCGFLDEDAVQDETCGHGADDLIVGAKRNFVGP